MISCTFTFVALKMIQIIKLRSFFYANIQHVVNLVSGKSMCSVSDEYSLDSWS